MKKTKVYITMTPEQRKERAKKAAAVKWANHKTHDDLIASAINNLLATVDDLSKIQKKEKKCP